MFLDCTGDCYVTQYSLHCYVTAMLQFAMLLDTFGWKVKSEAGMVGGLPPGLQISGEAGKCSKKLHCTAFSGRKHLPKISPSSSSARPGHFLLSTAVPSHFVISLPLERGTLEGMWKIHLKSSSDFWPF